MKYIMIVLFFICGNAHAAVKQQQMVLEFSAETIVENRELYRFGLDVRDSELKRSIVKNNGRSIDISVVATEIANGLLLELKLIEEDKSVWTIENRLIIPIKSGQGCIVYSESDKNRRTVCARKVSDTALSLKNTSRCKKQLDAYLLGLDTAIKYGSLNDEAAEGARFNLGKINNLRESGISDCDVIKYIPKLNDSNRALETATQAIEEG